MLKLLLVRDEFQALRTLGTLYADAGMIGYTCEDTDRHLEDGGEKVQDKTAIPRGIYRVVMSWSPHFKRFLPELLEVPKFEYVRIHGGNTEADTRGCILIGALRTATGIAQCANTLARLILMIQTAEQNNEQVWIEVR